MTVMMMMVITSKSRCQLDNGYNKLIARAFTVQCVVIEKQRKNIHMHTLQEKRRAREPDATSQIARIMITLNRLDFSSSLCFAYAYAYIDVAITDSKMFQQLVNECRLSSPVIAIHEG